MNASTRPRFLQASLLFATLTTVAIVGCSASPPSDSATGNGNQTANLGAAPECAGKACGADCSPAGSDEPFNCDAARHCVAAGAKLDCKACPEFLGDCMTGQIAADLNGDGCIDGCKAAAPGCAEFLGDCIQGQFPADLNGDGCIDGCKAR